MLPFDPVNDETEGLLTAFTGSYTTTAKRQMDRLVTELKSAGVWGKLDWYAFVERCEKVFARMLLPPSFEHVTNQERQVRSRRQGERPCFPV